MRPCGKRGENVRRRGDFRKSRDFRLRAEKNDCNEKSERGGTIEIREKVAKKKSEVDFEDDDEDEKTEKKKKKKKKKKKNKKSTPGEQESLEAIAKRLAKQEMGDQNHFENEDDSDVFGESTSTPANRRDGYSDTESDPASTRKRPKRKTMRS